MRHILVHDYAGHPFPVDLSRDLARRGYRVSHAWFASDPGPKGALRRRGDDPDDLHFVGLGAGQDYSKAKLMKRRQGDVIYGRHLAAWVRDNRPDVVLSGNTPTEAQDHLARMCKALGIPWIYWCQDFYSIAVSRLLTKRLPGVGHLVAGYYQHLERRQMQQAARVALITDSFRNQCRQWRIPPHKTEVIANWGGIDHIDVQDRHTAWAASQSIPDRTRFLYAGTLAMKHNPALLAALARQVGPRERVVAVAAGVGATALRAQQIRDPSLSRLTCLPLQPFETLPQVLASGDILLALIEREAGVFSVPSKILNYLCAGRPVVLAAPADNLAAQILQQSGAGTVVEPEDHQGFAQAALRYRDDPAAAARAGQAGRAYAEQHFHIDQITTRFEALLRGAYTDAHQTAAKEVGQDLAAGLVPDG